MFSEIVLKVKEKKTFFYRSSKLEPRIKKKLQIGFNKLIKLDPHTSSPEYLPQMIERKKITFFK